MSQTEAAAPPVDEKTIERVKERVLGIKTLRFTHSGSAMNPPSVVIEEMRVGDTHYIHPDYFSEHSLQTYGQAYLEPHDQYTIPITKHDWGFELKVPPEAQG